MRVSIAGVVVGGFTDVMTSFLLGIPIVALGRLQAVSAQRDLGAVVAKTTWARMHAHPLIWTIEFLVSLLCSAFGGYVAAAIAGHDERLNGTLSCWLCISVGLLFLPLGLHKDPWWLHAFFMLLSPIMGLLGGDLRLRQRRARTPQFRQAAL
jgi:CHASE2 domain-containing sensor protein